MNRPGKVVPMAFPKSITQWWVKDRGHDRPATRGVYDCHKCKLKINYGFDKSGTYISCPRCRVSIKLPDSPVMVRCESESGYNYQSMR
jgi:DNA-directed RNA polymerase subunit RPC12/RpoP